jgi:hypothetical protein
MDIIDTLEPFLHQHAVKTNNKRSPFYQPAKLRESQVVDILSHYTNILAPFDDLSARIQMRQQQERMAHMTYLEEVNDIDMKRKLKDFDAMCAEAQKEDRDDLERMRAELAATRENPL